MKAVTHNIINLRNIFFVNLNFGEKKLLFKLFNII